MSELVRLKEELVNAMREEDIAFNALRYSHTEDRIKHKLALDRVVELTEKVKKLEKHHKESHVNA